MEHLVVDTDSGPLAGSVAQAADLGAGETILANPQHRRAFETTLRSPCRASVDGRATVWLGFRIGTSPWPGYLRIGFAADLDFNAATLDIHKDEFPALLAGVARALEGLPAGINFSIPGEICSGRTYRRATPALLIKPAMPGVLGEGKMTLDALTMDYDVGLSVEGWTLDFQPALRALPSLMELVPDGPARRSLRAIDDVEEALLPPSVAGVVEGLGHHQIQVSSRLDQQFNELTVDLPKVPAAVRSVMTSAEELSFDFTEWPVLLALTHRNETGEVKTEIFNIDLHDLEVMRSTLTEDLWRVRSAGHIQLEVPQEVRPALLAEVERRMILVHQELAPKNPRALQMSLTDELSPGGRQKQARNPKVKQDYSNQLTLLSGEL